MRTASLLVLASSLLSLASAISQTGPAAAVASPNGVIVPFQTLPACASLCGPLFDVQGSCSPPVLSAVSQSCFCNSADLSEFQQGTSGVEAKCGPESCQDTASLQEILTWYDGYCNKAVVQPTATTATSSSTSTSTSTNTSTPSKNQNKSWIAGHYGWVIFAVVVTLSMAGGWVGASYLRRRYLQKKEKEIEMRPPVAWGPHQTQAMTGGFNNSEAALSGRVASPLGNETKAAAGEAVYPDSGRGNRESRGWLRKERR
ncbi:hypothetical protein OIDMADRAFT_158870 [Oidiodendron maius Zn]|jgi:hypothetical protein|uniref:Extracellular membrane protein CFEM domain-containing protein n=1 Tax=Oidiodendron maius (strain Zn) TaxID=913774 RepID=A0A0C3HNK2_OIDMZ|nr:hypothetical protein OIDMADRAFT_158870 [Oidiodendron maius Zn]